MSIFERRTYASITFEINGWRPFRTTSEKWRLRCFLCRTIDNRRSTKLQSLDDVLTTSHTAPCFVLDPSTCKPYSKRNCFAQLWRPTLKSLTIMTVESVRRTQNFYTQSDIPVCRRSRRPYTRSDNETDCKRHVYLKIKIHRIWPSSKYSSRTATHRDQLAVLWSVLVTGVWISVTDSKRVVPFTTCFKLGKTGKSHTETYQRGEHGGTDKRTEIRRTSYTRYYIVSYNIVRTHVLLNEPSGGPRAIDSFPKIN